MAKATKKAAKKTKGTGVVEPGSERRGRKSAYCGTKITKLVEDGGFRPGCKVEESWKAIKNGITFEKYMENGGARKALADFIKAGKVSVTPAKSAAA